MGKLGPRDEKRFAQGPRAAQMVGLGQCCPSLLPPSSCLEKEARSSHLCVCVGGRGEGVSWLAHKDDLREPSSGQHCESARVPESLKEKTDLLPGDRPEAPGSVIWWRGSRRSTDAQNRPSTADLECLCLNPYSRAPLGMCTGQTQGWLKPP